jgi:type I restriction enzyme, S subunit
MSVKIIQVETKKVPKLRFSDFSDEWKEKELRECADRIWIGLVTTMTTSYSKEGTRLIRNQNIRENKIVDEFPIHLNKKFADLHKSRALKLGDIITVHTGDVGTSAVIDHKYDGAHGFATLNTRVDASHLCNLYLSCFFNSKKYKNWALRYSTGDGRNNLNLYDFIKSKIPLPSVLEQQKIAEFLGATDKWIENLRAQKENLESHKKGMMQKIFSQEIRFKDDKGKNFPKWEEKKLGEVCEYKNGGSFESEVVKNGKYNMGECIVLTFLDFCCRIVKLDKRISSCRKQRHIK